jgi:hypothetical protein
VRTRDLDEPLRTLSQLLLTFRMHRLTGSIPRHTNDTLARVLPALALIDILYIYKNKTHFGWFLPSGSLRLVETPPGFHIVAWNKKR